MFISLAETETETARVVDEAVDEEELGLEAAWRYLRLAWRAVWRPLRDRLPPFPPLPQVSWATRAYLIFNVWLYTTAASAFLLPAAAGVHVGRTGVLAVDTPALHLLWGVGAFGVAAAQVAALVSARWVVWQICATSTAMWASAWAVVTLFMAHTVGNYAGAVLWLWVVGVHFLFISNQLVPHHSARQLAATAAMAGPTQTLAYDPHDPSDIQDAQHVPHTPEDEQALIRELARVARAPLVREPAPPEHPSPNPRSPIVS